MTTDDTPTEVLVPVELARSIHRILDDFDHIQEAAALEALIPKPRPRIVFLYDFGDSDEIELSRAWLDEQPDLLDLLDDVIDKWWITIAADAEDLKAEFRSKLGVPNE